jgi:hypothetical protein
MARPRRASNVPLMPSQGVNGESSGASEKSSWNIPGMRTKYPSPCRSSNT